MKHSLVFITLILTLLQNSYSQKNMQGERKQKISVTAGYGLAGSFFVRGFQKNTPFFIQSS
jgi:hypothetical protein